MNHPPIYPLPPHVCTRLWELAIPPRVYVVGAGKTGGRYFCQIPPDAYTIALNRMIAYPRPWSIWMAYDKNAILYDWFQADVPSTTRLVFGTALARRRRADYFFNSGGGNRAKTLITPHGLRGGGTIAGCALQLAFLAGAEHVTLVGCDFSGETHYDGTRAAPKAGPWSGRIKWMLAYIRYFEACGKTVDSLGPTALGLRKAAA